MNNTGEIPLARTAGERKEARNGWREEDSGRSSGDYAADRCVAPQAERAAQHSAADASVASRAVVLFLSPALPVGREEIADRYREMMNRKNVPDGVANQIAAGGWTRFGREGAAENAVDAGSTGDQFQGGRALIQVVSITVAA